MTAAAAANRRSPQREVLPWRDQWTVIEICRKTGSQDISRRSLLLAAATFAAASAFGSTASAQTPKAQQRPPTTNTLIAVADDVVPFKIQVPDAVLADLRDFDLPKLVSLTRSRMQTGTTAQTWRT